MTLFETDANPNDEAIQAVYAVLQRSDPDGIRIAKVLRRTFDQLYDGQHTGRYAVDQLYKTEKTHFGTLIEINLQREFKLADGDVLDYSVAGHEVDCKYSHSGSWMLPIESFEQVVLVIQADDRASRWSAGVVRVTEENRRSSENRDRKTGLNALGRSRIRWLHQDASMPPNALLQIESTAVERIMAPHSGQARVNELLRHATGRRLTRNIVATVAQQDDFMKRVRENGGARSALRPEGYLVLGGDYHYQQGIARDLGTVVPEPGEIVCVAVTPADETSGVKIDEGWWRLCRPGEVPKASAPTLTHSGMEETLRRKVHGLT